jgi:flagellar hook assembly protein FlgD
MGREINTLVSGVQNSGMHSVKWDAREQNGRMVSSGVYLYRLEAAGQVLTDKMILLK